MKNRYKVKAVRPEPLEHLGYQAQEMGNGWCWMGPPIRSSK